MARFHHYILHNVWLIAAQRPTATRVAGFQTWKKVDRFVRRGEKGIAIMAPIIRHDAKLSGPTTNRSLDSARRTSSTSSRPKANRLRRSRRAPATLVTSWSGSAETIIARGIALESAADLGGALGTSSGGRIRILSGLAPATEFVTLAHEYAHELLHHGDDRPASRDTRELEAEAVAFVVSQAIGVDALDSARDYIHLYRGDRPALQESLNRIQSTAASILNAIGTP